MTANLIEWSDAFLIGIEELDYEHRSLIDDINELHRELTEHDDKDKIENTLGDILVRMQTHFALEEHVMQANKFPGYNEHKTQHNKLLDEYTGFLVQCKTAPDTGDCQAVKGMLNMWIVEHILTSDKQMSAMVKDVYKV
ncbi:MAG: bacteriohemerythrin [Rhodospirillales bacterium]|nr:bacteriohemerythrin [Rhodospirillales bacterium]